MSNSRLLLNIINNNNMWFVKDFCGIICAMFTWLLMAFSQFVVIFIILLPQKDTTSKYVNLIIFELFSFLSLASHLRTMLTNPGAVPRGTATREAIQELGMTEGQVLYKCQKCCSVKPERAHHCSVCQRCIRKMDHHCPWVNNCVGENNQKFFVLFTMYIAIISFHALILSMTHFYICIESEWQDCPGISNSKSSRSSPINLILMIFLVFEASLFAIFTIIMFVFQIKAIWNDETGIEHLKKESNRSKRKSFRSFTNVFGKDFRTWFSPFSRSIGGFLEVPVYSCQV